MSHKDSQNKKIAKKPPQKREHPSKTSLLIIRQYARCYRPMDSLHKNEELFILN